MSLIADALKRAKEAEQQAAPPAPPNLQFRPVEPAQYTRKGLGLMLPAALAVMALLALFFAWQWAQRAGLARPIEVRAAAATAANPAPAPPLAPASHAPVRTAEPAPVAQPAPALPPTAAVAAPPSAAPVTAATDTSAAIILPESTNAAVLAAPESGTASASAAVVAEPAPPPAPPKLQAIIFSPTRPSVMIGGRTLFIGDKLNEFRVVAIDRQSATLAGLGQTNVLTLSE